MSLKFNGKLDVAEGSTSQVYELSIKFFLQDVAEIAEHFDLETFFYIKDTYGKKKYLPEDPYSFILSDILLEHNSRIVEPNVINDTQTPPVESLEPTLV